MTASRAELPLAYVNQLSFPRLQIAASLESNSSKQCLHQGSTYLPFIYSNSKLVNFIIYTIKWLTVCRWSSAVPATDNLWLAVNQ